MVVTIINNLFYFSGALLNAFHVPERWLPRQQSHGNSNTSSAAHWSYCLNGHSLMHVCGFLVLLMGRKGLMLDLQWLSGKG